MAVKKRNGGKRGGGGSASGELVLPDGSKIEFDGDLHYDGNDKNVSGKTRQNIEAFETKRVKNKVEYAYATTADGTPIGNDIRGSKGSVRSPLSYHDTPDCVFTHTHPRGDGMLGGTFSGADLKNFARCKNKTVRAAAKEGTYSISKGKKFDQAGFMRHARDSEKRFNDNMSRERNRILKDYNSGKITHEEANRQCAKAFNTALVGLHEDLRSGQSKYGYTYTLEKRS